MNIKNIFSKPEQKIHIEDIAGNPLRTKYRPSLIKALQNTLGCNTECDGYCMKAKQVETWDEDGVRRVRKLCHLVVKLDPKNHD